MAQATQSRHPWRATVRTTAAVALALLPVLPEIADQLGVATYPVVASVLGIAAVVTRVLAMPGVNTALHRARLGWLAAEPQQPAVRLRQGPPPA